MAEIKAIAEALVDLTTEEVQNLAKVLKDEYGITAEEKVAQTATGMTFSGAIAALKQGKKVARQGWNGKGMWLWLKEGTMIKSDWCHDPALKAIADKNGGGIEALGTVCMKTADNKILSGWLASQTDVLSHDWVVIE
jgi:hypothetical protein